MEDAESRLRVSGQDSTRRMDDVMARSASPNLSQIGPQGLLSIGSNSSFPPSTAMSERSATPSSTTHAPSLTSRAFFTPMSSQRLQAHRAQRPLSHQAPPKPHRSEDFGEEKSATNRNSTGSVVTTRAPDGSVVNYDLDALPPPSRGTDYTDWTNNGRLYTSAEFNRAFQPGLRQESLEPLQRRRDPPPPIPTNHIQSDETASPSPNRERSPRSLMANFQKLGKNSVNSGLPTTNSNGHSRLQSSSSPAVDSIEEKKMEIKQNLGRNYEYFTGRTVFFWGGRFQNARARPVVLFTGLLIILPTILFFVFSAPFLWHHVSPAVPIFFAYIFYICFSSFIHAAVSNPGILPRNLHTQQMPDLSVNPLAVQASNRWVLVKSAKAQHGLFEIPTKYCATCNIWRPPRCHHCRVCDNCIETQDHHCVWLNNCVGRRNYRQFFAFIVSGAVLGFYLFAASLGHIGAWASQRAHGNWATSINHNRVPMAMVIFGLLGAGYPFSLVCYHLFLISRGQTTHEFLNATRFRELDRHRPFNQAKWWQNFTAVLSRPRPPTYLNFKAKYEEGDQRFGERKGHRTTPLAENQKGGGGHEMKQLKYPAAPSFQGPRSRAPIDVTPR